MQSDDRHTDRQTNRQTGSIQLMQIFVCTWHHDQFSPRTGGEKLKQHIGSLWYMQCPMFARARYCSGHSLPKYGHRLPKNGHSNQQWSQPPTMITAKVSEQTKVDIPQHVLNFVVTVQLERHVPRHMQQLSSQIVEQIMITCAALLCASAVVGHKLKRCTKNSCIVPQVRSTLQ